MISHIMIKDFAIIENAEFTLYPGLNIFTGETGSGKSIVIEAISLALGARADSSMVRTGKQKAIVQIVGEIGNEEMIITREIYSAGKNLCKLNGEIVTLTQLASYCHKLADIHGQYDHQSLMNPEYHLSLIDMYHSARIDPFKSKVKSLFTEYDQCNQSLLAMLATRDEAERKRNFMRFESDEIQQISPYIGEDSELSEQIAVMQNSEKVYAALSQSYEIAYDSPDSIIAGLNRMMKNMEEISALNDDFRTLATNVSDIYYRLEDICRDMRSQRDSAIFSPAELDTALARLETLDSLKRKYGHSIDAVLAYKEKIDNELTLIDHIEDHIADMQTKRENLAKELTQASQELSALRKHSATELCTKIENELRQLSFNNAELNVEFDHINKDFSPNGIDVAQFLISTNVGEPLKPLAKIASGGEMSRIMLAFKTITAEFDQIPTLIFDEIDTGISGLTASIVGKKLKEIARARQILCITHLPQIAACGAHNYKIQKESDQSSTHTYVSELSPDEKVLEIAKLLGGATVTETTLKSAQELIATS